MAGIEQVGGGIRAALVHRYGPLPLWMWLGGGLAAALLIAKMRQNKSTNAAAASGADATAPPDTTPAPIYQSYVTVTGPYAPPAGGRTDTPGGPPAQTPPAGATGGSGTGPPPSPGHPPAPKPGPSPVPSPAPASTTITVARFTTKDPPWNSTLSGIATKEGYGGDWQAIWNAPANAALKARRKEPELIRPGDKIVVPAR